jgi:ubiquitin-activating enzyme E1
VNFSRESILHLAFLTLGKYVETFKGYPKSYNEEDAKNFISLAKKINEGDKYLESVFLDEEYLKKFSFSCYGNLNPTATFLGAAVAQEVLKAITKKYEPMNQLYYYTMMESLADPLPTEEDCQPQESRYDGQIAVFGNKFQKQLGNSKSFIVGAGALGCEYIKNYALMGISCGPKGKTYVTDLDTIDVSNLSRQFLFRKEHVGKMKSLIACQSAVKMNNCFNVKDLQDRVGPETENVFNDKFWESLDFVTNALDNVQARVYVDSRCVFYCKPLLESGTLGTLANSAVFLPHKTLSYASSKDAPQKALPQCTVHTFPNLIQHTIIWSRQLFDSYFTSSPKSAFSYLSNPEQFLEKNTDDLFVLESVWYKLKAKPDSYDECITWARAKFEEIFIHLIKNILEKYPSDHKTESGGQFWSGNKKCPTILSFNWNDFSHKQFIASASKLYADVYDIALPENYDDKKFEEICATAKLPTYTVKKVITGNEEEDSNQPEQKKETEEDKKKRMDYYAKIKSDLKDFEKFKHIKINPVDFEKDQEFNFHMDFITSASNIRASAYGIPEADKHKTKGIAGNIIPAMITTTAMVTGLIGNETYKVVQGRDLDYFRNSYINLGFNAVQQSTPAPCKNTYLDKYTLWDRFDINEGTDISLQKFIDILKERYSLELIMLVYGGNPIYVDMNKNEQLLAAPVGMIVEAFSGSTFDSNKKFLEFSFSATFEGKSYTELPTIKYQFKFFQNEVKKKKVLKKK